MDTYLKLRTTIKYYFNNISNKLFDTYDVTTIDTTNKQIKNIYLKYITIRGLDYMIIGFKKIRDYLDIDIKKIKIIKIKNGLKKSIILNKNIKNSIHHIYDNDNINNNIFSTQILYINFKLIQDKNKNEICLKKLINEYRDHHKLYDHTLENILLFNNINFNINDRINITTFSINNKKSFIFIINDIKDMHLKDLDEYISKI